MYKVFVNDIPIILSTESELDEKYLTIPIKEAKIKRIIKRINKGQLLYVNLYHPKEEKLLKHLFKKLPVVTAGGGLVRNPKGEVLFIFRNGRWDLPKGKIEKKEEIQACAIREVEEETGVQGLQVHRLLDRTYHIFQRKGKFRVKWKDQEKARKALRKSYANIKMLFPESLLPEYSKHGVS